MRNLITIVLVVRLLRIRHTLYLNNLIGVRGKVKIKNDHLTYRIVFGTNLFSTKDIVKELNKQGAI